MKRILSFFTGKCNIVNDGLNDTDNSSLHDGIHDFFNLEELINYVKHNDLKSLGMNLSDSHISQCESLLSIACHNGFIDIVEYLLTRFGPTIITDRVILSSIKSSNRNVINLIQKYGNTYQNILIDTLLEKENIPIDYCIICKKSIPLMYMCIKCEYCGKNKLDFKKFKKEAIENEKRLKQEAIEKKVLISKINCLNQKIEKRNLLFHNKIKNKYQDLSRLDLDDLSLNQLFFELHKVLTCCLNCGNDMAYHDYTPLKYPNWTGMKFVGDKWYNNNQQYCTNCKHLRKFDSYYNCIR